ncbi:MAG: hypothetical protein H6587_00370 [Flavobacteriales bacterium]|nr:hypothetical protein [Flavobacteriales bacterium]MCB9362999.1 hypothetical protein [Flavobacteriales bacterium]
MKYLILLSITFFFFSCGSTDDNVNEITNDSTQTEEVFIDDANAEITAADTSSTGVFQEEADENLTLQESLKANAEESHEEVDGMSFCDCVKKQKQLEKIMLETEDDTEFDNAMEELNNMKTGECKILFEGNQSTIEAKQAHERKVKKCL